MRISDCSSDVCSADLDFCIMSSHVPVWFRQLPYSTLKDILLAYVTRPILVSCASRAARSLSSTDVPTIMPATGASPAWLFFTQPIYIDTCPKTLSQATTFFNSITTYQPVFLSRARER